MAYSAKVVEIMIAGPGDVKAETAAIREVVIEWNTLAARERHLVLLPMSWDTHSAPDLAGRPQQIINERLLRYADILVAVFSSRIGTSTGRAPGGSVEEVKQHHAAGKPAMVYFSRKVSRDTYDPHQAQALREFQEWATEQGLIHYYDDAASIRDDFRRHLQLQINQSPYIRDLIEVDFVAHFEKALATETSKLSDAAIRLLQAAETDSYIIVASSIDMPMVHAGDTTFGGNGPRELAKWIDAVEELERCKMIRPAGERGVFQMTELGYRQAETVDKD